MAKLILFPKEVRETAANFAEPKVDKVLTETEALAKRYAPVRKPRPYDKRPTGRLRRSIHKHGPKRQVTQVKGDVGSRARHAAAVHQGAVPHAIIARNKPKLVFYWAEKDVTFVGKRVSHPGVRRFARTQYLYLPLAIVGRRNGFIVRRLQPGLASSLP